MKIHHIGYLVKNIGKAEESFRRLGYSCLSERVEDEIRRAEIRFMRCGGYTVELVSPKADSELYGLLKKYKSTAYHICYEVASLGEAVGELEKQGFHLFKEPEPAPAIGENASVAFLMDANIGMIELVEGTVQC